MALDLSLRDRSDGKITLDDFMRAMWTRTASPDGPQPGDHREAVHAAGCARPPRGRLRRPRVRRRVLRQVHRGTRGAGLRDAVRTCRARAAQAKSPGSRGLGVLDRECAGGRAPARRSVAAVASRPGGRRRQPFPSSCRGAHRHSPPASKKRTSSPRWTGGPSTRVDEWQAGAPRAQARETALPSATRATARRRPRHRRWERIRRWRSYPLESAGRPH